MNRQHLEQIIVAVQPDEVWPLLIEPRTWSSWWPAVTFARTSDFKPLREGSKLEITLDLGRFRSTIKPRVTFLADGKSMTWEGSWFGVPLKQEWFLAPQPDGCRVSLRSTFLGVGSAVLALLRFNHVWLAMTRDQMQGLKRLAERM